MQEMAQDSAAYSVAALTLSATVCNFSHRAIGNMVMSRHKPDKRVSAGFFLCVRIILSGERVQSDRSDSSDSSDGSDSSDDFDTLHPFVCPGQCIVCFEKVR